MHLWFPEALMLCQELDSFVLPMRKESEVYVTFVETRTVDIAKYVYTL